jgi:hypothetical protein
MKRYRVLKDRFVYRHGTLVSAGRRRPGEFEKGDVLAAAACPLLRRAVADGDLDLVEVESGTAAGRKPARAKDDTP